MNEFLNPEFIFGAVVLGGLIIGTIVRLVTKNKKLKPTPRPNREPYNSDTFRK